MPNQYRKGANFEREVQYFLELREWDVFRSAGSHSPTDLIAMHLGKVLFIQCKLNGKLKESEIIEILDLELRHGGIAVLAYRESRKIKLKRIRSRVPRFTYKWVDDTFNTDRITGGNRYS